MGFYPSPVPSDIEQLPEFLNRELQRLGQDVADNAEVVLYRTLPVNAGSLTDGVSANYKIAAGNVVRISSSATVIFTGLASVDPYRELVLFNVGTGVVVLKTEDAESSASYRFALPADWNLSADAAAILWRDPYSARWRGLSKT